MILLPGFGCDGRVFGPQRRAFGDRLETPGWITPEPNESIRAYAQRWAGQLSRPGDDRPLCLGGLSLGGLVAQEMARFIRPTPRAVLLIASADRPERWSLAAQAAQWLGGLVPGPSVNTLASLLAIPFALRDGLDDEGKALLRAMAQDADPAVLKWSAAAAMDWPGPPETPPAIPPETSQEVPRVYRVHGTHDWVIPDDGQADSSVELGRHLINLSHAPTVNRFLFESMLRHVPEANRPVPRVEDPHQTAQRRLVLEGAPAGTPLD